MAKATAAAAAPSPVGARVPVPAILRFLLIIGVVVGLVWGAMVALVSFVQPEPREMTQTLAPNRLNK